MRTLKARGFPRLGWWCNAHLLKQDPLVASNSQERCQQYMKAIIIMHNQPVQVGTSKDQNDLTDPGNDLDYEDTWDVAPRLPMDTVDVEVDADDDQFELQLDESQEDQCEQAAYFEDVQSVATDTSEVNFHVRENFKNIREVKEWVQELVTAELDRFTKGKSPGRSNVLKSPSDTTVYAPGLMRVQVNSQNIVQRASRVVNQVVQSMQQPAVPADNEIDRVLGNL